MNTKTISIDKIDIDIDSINFDSYALECPICYEIKAERIYGKCSHSWCIE